MIRKILFFSFLLISAFRLQATHLLGGIMYYEYIGRTGPGQVNAIYKVSVKIYRDCLNGQAEFDDPFALGIYDDNRKLVQTVQMYLKTFPKNVSPVKVANCTTTPKVCIEEGYYSEQIIVEANKGFHLLYQRCCRNAQNNLMDDVGQSYYCYIPPATYYPDNSPVIIGVPAPYICAGDTVTYSNMATDAEGDSLVYSIEQPWSGGDRGDPKPNPKSTIQIPLELASYKGGYNNSIPFGNGGMLTINSATGLTTMLAPNTGQYSFAVVVKEYRKVNGVWVYLSEIRRDLQLIVVQCPPNAKPQLVNGGATSHTVEAGDSICFDVNYYDPDYNSYTYKTKMNLTSTGDILYGTNGYTGPRATLKLVSSQNSNILYRFCWNVSCIPKSLARTYPYSFNVSVNDSGCPPKNVSNDFYITVTPYVANAKITGNNKPCLNQIYTYIASSKKGYKFNWIINGPGNIISGNGTNTIRVQWTATGAGSLTVNDTTAMGCIGDPVTFPVTIYDIPMIHYAMTGDTVVCEKSTEAYSVPPKATATFFWMVTGGIQVSGGNSNSISIKWGSAGQGLVQLVEGNFAGCTGDTLKYKVRIADATIDTIQGPRSVCPNITFVEYKTDYIPGMKYKWFISGGTQSAGNDSNVIRVNWGDVGTGTLKVMGTSKEGCPTDTVYATVIKNHTILGFTPIGDSVVCEFEQNKEYEVVYTRRSLYSWFVTGGTIVAPTYGPKITVNWGARGIGKVTCVETSFDSVNNLPCNGEPATLTVRISPIPDANKIIGNMFLCQTADSFAYHVDGLPGSRYTWWLDGDSASISGQGSSTAKFVWTVQGKHTLRVLEFSKDSCIGNAIDTAVQVNPKPTTSTITGDATVCYPNIVNRPYSVSGFANSLFYWKVTNGIVVSGGNTNTINISFFDVNNCKVEVVEVSEFGCIGDTQKLDVFVDHPGIVIKSVSDAVENEKNIILQWKLQNAPRYNSNFEIWKRKAHSGNAFVLVDTVSKSDSAFIHRNQNTDDEAYEYEVHIKNLCGDIIVAPFHRNILLSGSKTNDDQYAVDLHWNRYYGWTDGVKTYELYRKMGEGGYALYDLYNDTSASYKNGFDSYYQCYRIRAVENVGGFEQESWSNEICFGFDPIVWIPNAFSPDGNDLNDVYKIFTASLKEFHIKIYDRWGEFIFESDDPNVSWDGTLHGKPCNMDVYVFMIEYKGFENIRIIRNGTVHLIR